MSMENILKGSIDKFIEETRHRHRGSATIGEYHPSHIPYCMRKVFFDFKIGKEFPMEVKRKMEAGKVIHRWCDTVFKSNSDLTVLTTERKGLKNLDGYELRGTCDFIVEHEGEKSIIDIKSTSYLQSQINKGTDLKTHHIDQLMAYMQMFEIKVGYLLYIDRSDLVTSCHRIEYDLKKVEAIFARISTIHKHLVEDTFPIAEGKLEKEREWECKYCPYTLECNEVEKES